jgi:hypothetical protein
MTEVLFLGVTCVGLGLYCLHLRSECNKLHAAGQAVTRLLCEQLEGVESPELVKVRAYIQAAKELHDLHK